MNNTEGRVPPNDTDAEQTVLGAMMLDRNAVGMMLEVLRPEGFYMESHEFIFQAIRRLFDRGETVDIIAVTAELRKMGTLDKVGGAYYVTNLTNRVSSAAHIETHARIITQKYFQRQLIRWGALAVTLGYDDTADVFTSWDAIERDMYDTRSDNTTKNFSELATLINKEIKNIEAIQQNDTGITGIPSGFNAIDRITAGWQKSDLIVIAARPGMGKTAFVMSCARNAAIENKKAVAVFSLEMSSSQLVTRLISSESDISIQKLKRGDLYDHEWTQLDTRIRKLSDASIYIDDTAALSVFDLKAKCRRLKAKHGVELFIVDYLQLMRADDDRSQNREQQISYISRSLKALAKELDAPVIALAQLSREVEKTPDKRPLLSHLRESGSIEQDADMVGFLYRPEYYGIEQDEEGNDLHGVAEFIIAKHRNGAVDTARIRFIGQYTKFTDLEYTAMSFETPHPDARITPNKDQDEDLPF